MQELIKITKTTLNQEEINAVNARELHQFLESKQEFAHWIKSRIDKYQFISGQDFTSFDNFIKREKGSSVAKDYIISIDMAKELAMVENNEKGRQARKYFIDCEKKLKQVQNKLDINNNPLAYAEELIKVTQKFIESETQRQELQSTVDTITSAKNSYTIRQLAKHLKDCGEKKLFSFLRESKILMKDNTPYQDYVSRGYLKARTIAINKGYDIHEEPIIENHIQPLVTAKGLEYITKLWNKEK